MLGIFRGFFYVSGHFFLCFNPRDRLGVFFFFWKSFPRSLCGFLIKPHMDVVSRRLTIFPLFSLSAHRPNVLAALFFGILSAGPQPCFRGGAPVFVYLILIP